MSDFEQLVLEMREAQKAWYRYHDQQYLMRAKALERKVDAALEKKAAADTDPTPDLFGNSNGGNGNRRGGANTANLSDLSDLSDGSDGAGTGGLGWVPGGGAE